MKLEDDERSRKKEMKIAGDRLVDAMLLDRFGVKFGDSIVNFTTNSNEWKVALRVLKPFKYLDRAEGHFTEGRLTRVDFGSTHDPKIAIEPWQKAIDANVEELRQTILPSTNLCNATHYWRKWDFSNYNISTLSDSWFKDEFRGVSITASELQREIEKEVRNRGSEMPDPEKYRLMRKKAGSNE